MAEKLKARGDDIKSHWRHFVAGLERAGLVAPGLELAPKGYSYFLRDRVEVVRHDDAYIVGDAVGLATRDLCEGIGPAIASGQAAARSIATGAEYSLGSISAFSLDSAVLRRLLEWMFLRGAGRRAAQPSSVSEAA